VHTIQYCSSGKRIHGFLSVYVRGSLKMIASGQSDTPTNVLNEVTFFWLALTGTTRRRSSEFNLKLIERSRK
jgi:hypothetical protein